MQSLGEDRAEVRVWQAVSPVTEVYLRWSKVGTLQGAQQPLRVTWAVKVLPLPPTHLRFCFQEGQQSVWTKWPAISSGSYRHLLSRHLTTTANVRFLPP